jgi:hypothetical protein
MKKKTKIILLLAISLITLSIGVHYKYLKVYGTIQGGGHIKNQNLDEYIATLEGMANLQNSIPNLIDEDFSVEIKRLNGINNLCYFLFFISGIVFILLLRSLIQKETIAENRESNIKLEC